MDLNEKSIPAPPDCTYRSYDEAYNPLIIDRSTEGQASSKSMTSPSTLTVT
jgi:hypothetical protein